MNPSYHPVNNDSNSSSTTDTIELEMTSLSNGGPLNPISTGNTATYTAPRFPQRPNPSSCSKRTVILLVILIPIGLAAFTFIILLAAGIVSPETLGITSHQETSQDFVTCQADEMRCDNKYECLNNKYVCNGIEDCSDNSDERGCEGGCQIKSSKYFHCMNGDCIKAAWRCDRERDCPHGDDELNCGDNCDPSMYFTCFNYECMPRQSRCDGKYDCRDRSDEYSCFSQVDDTIKYSYNGSAIDLCHTPDVPLSAGRICAQLGHRSDGAVSSPIPRDNASAPAVTIVMFPETSKTAGTFIINEELTCREAVNLQCGACGGSTKQIWSAYLVGGDGGSSISDWPWHVKLTIGTRHICGGSIVSDRWILTAAHCVSNYSSSPHEVKAVFGTNQFNGEGGFHRIVKSVALHPKYSTVLYWKSFTTYSYDIALVEVDKIEYSHNVKPVCLPTQDDLVSEVTSCYITGFGSIVANPNKPRYPVVLQEGKTRVWSKVDCGVIYKSTFSLDVQDDWLCAGYDTAGVDSCGGDSGGPLVCMTNSHWVLQGVVSWGSSCKQSLPSIYTRVSTATDWINLFIN